MFRKLSTIAAALATTAMLAVAAAPAHAIYGGGYEPADGDEPVAEQPVASHNESEDVKMSCEDETGYHEHGTTIEVTYEKPDGTKTTRKWRCNDGTWDLVSATTAPSDHYHATEYTYYTVP